MNKKSELALRIIILSAPLFFLSYFSFELPFLNNIFFSNVVTSLELSGFEFVVMGHQIVFDNFSAFLSFDCVGWKQLYLFLALIFIPIGVDIYYRLQGLVLLFPLYVFNIGRILISIYTGINFPEFFFPVHYFLWNFVFLVLVFILWYCWFLNRKTGQSWLSV